MKKKLSLLLAFVLCLGLMPCAYADNNPFNDVAPGFWAYDAILETYNDGVMTGDGLWGVQSVRQAQHGSVRHSTDPGIL